MDRKDNKIYTDNADMASITAWYNKLKEQHQKDLEECERREYLLCLYYLFKN